MEIIDPDGMLTEGRLDAPDSDARFRDPEYRALLARVAAAAEPAGEPAPRVTWADIEAVYPDIAPADLRAELAGYGYGEHQLDDLVFEVVVSGSWASWSNQHQVFVPLTTPDFWPFTQGGILVIMAGSTREPFGPGRKTSKWFVGTEVYQTYAEAFARSEEVKAAPPQGNGAPEDYAYLWQRSR